MSRASRKAWFDARRQVNTWIELAAFRRLKAIAAEQGLSVSAYAKHVLLLSISSSKGAENE